MAEAIKGRDAGEQIGEFTAVRLEAVDDVEVAGVLAHATGGGGQRVLAPVGEQEVAQEGVGAMGQPPGLARFHLLGLHQGRGEGFQQLGAVAVGADLVVQRRNRENVRVDIRRVAHGAHRVLLAKVAYGYH